MRKYHHAVLYLKGIDNDLHGTPEFLQAASVDPNSDKKISPELEQECIRANIITYNNLAACMLASQAHNTESDFEKVIKYTDIVLELDESNDKAPFRKAQALRQVKDYCRASETYEKLKRVQANKGQAV